MKKIIITSTAALLFASSIYADNQNIANVERAQYSNETAVPDAKLKSDIQDKLGAGWFTEGYKQVFVDVKDGVVILKGSVETIGDKDSIEKDIRNMDGVKSLKSMLNVQKAPSSKEMKKEYPQDTYSSPEDEQLNMKIRDDVSSGWLWDSYTDVSLNTKNGVVTLRGYVSDVEDQQKLMNEIQKIEGVKEVKSELKIGEKNAY